MAHLPVLIKQQLGALPRCHADDRAALHLNLCRVRLLVSPRPVVSVRAESVCRDGRVGAVRRWSARTPKFKAHLSRLQGEAVEEKVEVLVGVRVQKRVLQVRHRCGGVFDRGNVYGRPRRALGSE